MREPVSPSPSLGSAIAAWNAGRRRGPGRAGRLSSATGRRRRAKQKRKGKAGATGSGCGAGGPGRADRRGRREGNPYRIFFDASCDRPGCYEGVHAHPPIPATAVLLEGMPKGLERVRERERRWQEARSGSRPRVTPRSPPRVVGAGGKRSVGQPDKRDILTSSPTFD